MQSIPSHLYCTTKNFLRYFAAYALISIILFVMTSGGWTGIVFAFFAWIPYVIVLLILNVQSYAANKVQKTTVQIPTGMIGFILFLQILLLLLNPGDCGDAPGTYQFIERIFLIGRDVCHTGEHLPTIFLAPLLPLLFVVYALTVVSGCIYAMATTDTQKIPEKQLPSILVFIPKYIVLLFIVLIAIYLIRLLFFALGGFQ